MSVKCVGGATSGSDGPTRGEGLAETGAGMARLDCDSTPPDVAQLNGGTELKGEMKSRHLCPMKKKRDPTEYGQSDRSERFGQTFFTASLERHYSDIYRYRPFGHTVAVQQLIYVILQQSTHILKEF